MKVTDDDDNGRNSKYVMQLCLVTAYIYARLQVEGNELLDCSSSRKCHAPKYFHP